jgi:hypothetical protein
MVVGCGSQLTLKLVRDVIQKDVIALSEGLTDHVSPIGDHIFMKNPMESDFIIIIDDLTAEQNLSSLLRSNSLIICCNRTAKQKFAKPLGDYGYCSTASVDMHEDLKAKIVKAYQMKGLRFIEVFAPCPQEWGFDTSLTVNVATDVTQAGIWPLFEIIEKKIILGKRPEKLGVLEPFHSIQSKYKVEQKRVEDDWKHLVQLSLI